MEVYFPSWFEIKRKHTIVDGAKNFFNIVNRVTKLPNAQIRTVALNVLQRNAYFAHPENVLLGMLGDNDENLRRLAVNKIAALRNSVFQCHIPIDDFEGGYCFVFVLFAIFILHSRESELYRYTLDGKSALAWELPFSRFMGHLSST